MLKTIVFWTNIAIALYIALFSYYISSDYERFKNDTHSLSQYSKLENKFTRSTAVNAKELQGYWENESFLYYLFLEKNNILIKGNRIVFKKKVIFLNKVIFEASSEYSIKKIYGKVLELNYISGDGIGLTYGSPNKSVIYSFTSNTMVFPQFDNNHQIDNIEFTKKY